MPVTKVTKADIEEARRTAAQLETTISKAREVPQTRGEEMLTNQQAPRESKSFGTDSNPFSFSRFLKFLITGDEGCAAHEVNTLRMYKKALDSTGCMIAGGASHGWWLPTSFETYGGQLTQNDSAEKNFMYVKSVFANTRPAYDPDEARWLEQRRYVKTQQTISQSAYDDSIGGTLVAPPIQGDVIPLIRPQAAFLAAGSQAMTLPPNGRYVAPRITAPPNVKDVGESQDTPTSQLGTDQMILNAKKLAGAVILTEEGTAFTSGTLDNIAQMELGRSLGLYLDAWGFYGSGGPQAAAGLTSNVYANKVINVETAYPSLKGIGANGNQLLPQYGDFFPALIAERSFNMDAATGAWVGRPSAFSTAFGLRADAVASNDQAGVMVDILRRFDNPGPTSWRGRKVVQSTNISGNETKGTNSNLSDMFFGIWQYAIFASYGAIQFMQGHNGNTFLRGQYILRGTMFGDIGYQYPDAFLWYPNVLGMGSNF